MAGILARVNSAEVSLSAATAKTVLQVTAASNHRVLVRSIEVAIKGVNPVATPVRVRVLRQTTAGTMTSATPVKLDSTDDETLQTTAQHTATAEPTAGDVLTVTELHPQAAMVDRFPYDTPIVVPGGTRLGIELLAVDAVTAAASITFEE